MIWLGIQMDHKLQYIFVGNGNVNQNSYLDMLQNYIWEEIIWIWNIAEAVRFKIRLSGAF